MIKQLQKMTVFLKLIKNIAERIYNFFFNDYNKQDVLYANIK